MCLPRESNQCWRISFKTECISHLEAISLGVKLYNIIMAQTGLFLTQFPDNLKFKVNILFHILKYLKQEINI